MGCGYSFYHVVSLHIQNRVFVKMGWKIGLNHLHDFHSRKRFIGEMGIYGCRAVRREVSFRTCGRQDGGTAVYGGESRL